MQSKIRRFFRFRESTSTRRVGRDRRIGSVVAYQGLERRCGADRRLALPDRRLLNRRSGRDRRLGSVIAYQGPARRFLAERRAGADRRSVAVRRAAFAAPGKRQRLIFVNRFFYPDHSATSELLTDLAFGLAAQGSEVHVICSRQRYDQPTAELAPRQIVNGVSVHRVWTSRFGRGRLLLRALDYVTFYASASGRLWRLARAADVVVAKTDPPLISVPAAWVVRGRGARLVNWLQDVFPEVGQALGVCGLEGMVGSLLNRLRNGSVRRASGNIVPGERMARRLKQAGAVANTIRVIPNWSDGLAIYPVEPRQNALLDEWHLRGYFVVGYSGNMGRVHEFDTVLRAAELLKVDERLMFLFTGGGYHWDLAQNRVRERQLENVRFKPYQPRERLSDSLGVADLHLISLRPEMEGLVFPSKLYGILAAGRPAIFVGAETGELAGILRRERCGFAVSQGDAEALVTVIRRLARDSVLRAEMGVRARRLFEERYDRKLALAAWFRVLGEVGVRGLEEGSRIDDQRRVGGSRINEG